MAIVRGNPRNISIHHSAVAPGAKNLTELKQRANSYNNSHKGRSEQWNNTTNGEFGYKWIRYHYMIARDGSVLQTQHEKYALFANGDGGVAGGNKPAFNYYGVNICFDGYFHPPKNEKPTEAMMKSAVKLIRDIEKRYKINPMVRGHREVGATACPGDLMGTSRSGWVKQLIDNVNNPNYGVNPHANWKKEAVKVDTPNYEVVADTNLYNFVEGKNTGTKFAKGSKIVAMYRYKDWAITEFSYNRGTPTGIPLKYLKVVKAPKPTPPPIKPTEIEQLKEQIERLQAEVFTLEEIVENFKTDLAGREKKIKELKKVINDLKEKQGSENHVSEGFLEWLVSTIKKLWNKPE